MRVYGYEVPQAVVEDCWRHLPRRFHRADVVRDLEVLGVPGGRRPIATGTAARLVAEWRKAGLVDYRSVEGWWVKLG